jgi:hypothetical protein
MVWVLTLRFRMHISSKSDSTAQKFEAFAPEALDRFVSEWTQFSDGAIPGTYGYILLSSVITCVLGKQRVKILRMKAACRTFLLAPRGLLLVSRRRRSLSLTQLLLQLCHLSHRLRPRPTHLPRPRPQRPHQRPTHLLRPRPQRPHQQPIHLPRPRRPPPQRPRRRTTHHLRPHTPPPRAPKGNPALQKLKASHFLSRGRICLEQHDRVSRLLRWDHAVNGRQRLLVLRTTNRSLKIKVPGLVRRGELEDVQLTFESFI